eukprot:CAMPEP_0114549604 /NCGR_PEP_ID=MMETSP0114-20121206/5616_1 /TAXON_ID=31324 /ORGANISM="Goniomonas sp, Strain m" /LENGTH=414 /DNA_ID=CAMNT_0001734297 /DNA_START=1 /DNA_END=1242 /DNA_ORIENTATION=+
MRAIVKSVDLKAIIRAQEFKQTAVSRRRGSVLYPGDQLTPDPVGFHDPKPLVERQGLPSRVVALMVTITESVWFFFFNLGVVLVAAVLIGLQTDEKLAEDPVLAVVETCVTWLFAAEVVFKVIARGSRPYLFFFSSVNPVLCIDYWNLFDFLIVVACFFDIQAVAVIRLLRLLRIVKLIRAIPTLRSLVHGLVKSMMSMLYIGLLLLLIFYIMGIMGIMFFQQNDPVNFGHLGLAFLSLMRCATADDWDDILYTNMYGCQHAVDVGMYPEQHCKNPKGWGALCAIYFFIFMMHLIIGVINSSMTELTEDTANEKQAEALLNSGFVLSASTLKKMGKDVDALAASLDSLLDKDPDDMLSPTNSRKLKRGNSGHLHELCGHHLNICCDKGAVGLVPCTPSCKRGSSQRSLVSSRSG